MGAPETHLELHTTIQSDIRTLNFGWPIVSYGDHYTSDIDRRYKLAPLKKSHNKFGFVAKAFASSSFFNPAAPKVAILSLATSR